MEMSADNSRNLDKDFNTVSMSKYFYDATATEIFRRGAEGEI